MPYIFHDRYIFVVLEVSLSLKCGTLLTLHLGPIIHTTVVTPVHSLITVLVVLVVPPRYVAEAGCVIELKL